jgi:thiol-disulfide isomerase/thioredoxin
MFTANRAWLIAGAAALGLGLSAIPFMSSGSGATGARAESTAANSGGVPDQAEKLKAATEAGVCNLKPKAARLDFTLKDMNGKEVKLEDYKGKVVMLNFWATWCGPCKIEIPMFTELQTRYKDQGLAFVGISVDDPPDALRQFAGEYKINYPVLVGDGRDDVQTAYGPMFGIPVTLLIARDGTICTRYLGPRPKERFERDIKALL